MKALTLIFLSAICHLSSFGQFSYGIKGGLNFSKLVIKEVPTTFAFEPETQTATSFHIGFFGQVELAKKLNLISELQYSRRSIKSKSGNVSAFQNINYLELPILTSFVIQSFSIDAGPMVSYRLSSTVDAYKDFDFGLVGGVKFRMTKNFFLTLRYYYGMLAISEIRFADVNAQYLGTAGIYNRNIQFSIGYKIK